MKKIIIPWLVLSAIMFQFTATRPLRNFPMWMNLASVKTELAH